MSTAIDPVRFLVRFVHVEKMLPPLPGIHDTLLADLLKMAAADLLAIRAELAAEVRGAAEELLDDAAFAAQVDRIPVPAGSAFVGFGDSLTDDLQSWLEILKQVFALRRPKDQVNVVNAGASGESTTQMMFRLPQVFTLNPSWVVCLAGTNDGRCFGEATGTPQVSLGETRRNFFAFADYAERYSRARWMWMTPIPPLAERVQGHWFWTPMATQWVPGHIHAIGEALCALGKSTVDIRPAFEGKAGADLLLDDGVHPALEGQKRILQELVARLAAA